MVDRGDATPLTAMAAHFGATIVPGGASRGLQKQRAVEAAGEGWLLVLHPGAQLSTGWRSAALRFVEAQGESVAGYGRFRLDEAEGQAARQLESLARLSTRLLGVTGPGQGLLIHTSLLHRHGGFRAGPLFEDRHLRKALDRKGLKPMEITCTYPFAVLGSRSCMGFAFKQVLRHYAAWWRMEPEKILRLFP